MTNNGEEEKALAPIVHGEVMPAASQEMLAAQARTISKFAEASTLDVTQREWEILHKPVELADVKIRPDGHLYLEHTWYERRLDEAFGPGRQWACVPAPWSPRLVLQGNITYREYCLYIRSQFAANAVGHHEETRKTSNFGDAAESTYANALMRCCKHLGIAQELWTKAWIDENKAKVGKRTQQPQTTIDVKPQPSSAVTKMIAAFQAIGVSREMLERRLQHSIDNTPDSELADLRKIHIAISQGEAISEYFKEIA